MDLATQRLQWVDVLGESRARMTGDWRVLKAAGKSREKRIAFDAGNFGGS
jgi:hypothetical protein